MVKKKTCVFISGKGSNLKNLINCSRDKNFPIKISLVICNNKNAYGISYVKKYQIPYVFIDTNQKNYENKILYNLMKYKISFICLAGYMKIISKKIVNTYKKKLLMFTLLYFQNLRVSILLKEYLKIRKKRPVALFIM